ncbi:mechanosensitive ion channel family protein [Hellea balneolensis]|uniref:mechanosensitive ion channel family protein n=1 Tax=Hellea balneolensis TaxID=287478 RepID=UPI00041E67FF|nr:mechanosensitive ion channel domain-containing protein [Hellea balneolensis]
MKNICHFIVVWCFALLCLCAPQAYAQDSAEPAAPEAEQTLQVPQSSKPADIKKTNPAVDLTDPALAKALDAREKADRAIARALREQQEKAAAERGEASDTPKKSLIPKNAEELKTALLSIWNVLFEKLKSPSFLAQIGAVIAAYFLSPIISGVLRKRIFLFRDKPQDGIKLKVVRDYIYRLRDFLRAILLVALLAAFAVILKSVPIAGQDWLVKLAQGLAVVFLLYKAIKTFIGNELIRKLATWILIPLALIIVFGYFDNLLGALNGAELMTMGDTPITAMTMVRLAVFGALFFWLGNLSNAKGQTAIRAQESLDMSVREIVAKLFQIFLFIILFVLILSFAGIPLSGLVVIFSAVGLGIGFGLQPIAANFISGLIILFDRTVQVGDFVVLPDGQEGHVEAINMRSTTVETTDGKDIMVPNTVFTESAYENWTHKDPRQRYEVYFTVSFDTDIDKLEDILIPAISEHRSVLQEPEKPDLELREFGDFGIKFAIEFWCSGIDDGPNKFTSDLNFIVWRTLKAHNVEIPFPQRVVRMVK